MMSKPDNMSDVLTNLSLYLHQSSGSKVKVRLSAVVLHLYQLLLQPSLVSPLIKEGLNVLLCMYHHRNCQHHFFFSHNLYNTRVGYDCW